jgi:hypothetical protein
VKRVQQAINAGEWRQQNETDENARETNVDEIEMKDLGTGKGR